MKQIFAVFKFTFMDAIRKKAFIISSIIIFAVTVILFSIPAIITAFDNSDTSAIPDADISGTADVSTENVVMEESHFTSSTCYYMDEYELIPSGFDTLSAFFSDVEFIHGDPEKAESYRAEIAENGSVSMIVISEMEGLPFINVTTKDFMSGISAASVAEVLSSFYSAYRLAEYGLGEEVIALAQLELPYVSQTAGNMQISGYIIGIVLVLVTFFAVYYYGYGVSMSIATEKTSRVMETLVVSAKPSRILLGKTLAMGILGLCQFAGMILTAVICYTVLIPDGFLIDGMEISLSAFTPKSALLLLLYFIGGYSLYAMMNAVCGASVSKIEDLNSAMMPVMMISLISFYVGYFGAITASLSPTLQKIAMYIPFTSPFLMPFKLLNGEISTIDTVISLAILFASTVLVAIISIRIYSASIMHYGKRLKLKDAFKMKV